MPQPCIVIASFQPLPGKTHELIALIESVIPQVHQEEGCELYALHQEVSGKLVMIEKWTTQAHWHVHNNAPSVAAIQAGLEVMRTIHEPTAAAMALLSLVEASTSRRAAEALPR